MRDDALLHKLKKDPENGMRLLMGQYMALVCAVVRSKLSPSAFCCSDIEECVADVFGDFYCSLGSYDLKQGSIKAWLCAIAKRKAIDRLRARQKEAGNVSLDDECTYMQYADAFSVEADFENKALRQELLQAICDLGEPDHEILVRKFYLSQSSKEIAEKLGMTVSNVDVRTHRALGKLRKRFEKGESV